MLKMKIMAISVLFWNRGDGSLRVYILDIQGKSREQIQQWLSEDIKLTVTEVFEDYIPFIELVWKSPPQCCVIRLGNNGIPGLKAAAMVRQVSPDTRIVFISDDRDYALDAYEIGADGYLLCPVERKKLKKYLMTEKEMRS